VHCTYKNGPARWFFGAVRERSFFRLQKKELDKARAFSLFENEAVNFNFLEQLPMSAVHNLKSVFVAWLWWWPMGRCPLGSLLR
jgi:hypothetical protein